MHRRHCACNTPTHRDCQTKWLGVRTSGLPWLVCDVCRQQQAMETVHVTFADSARTVARRLSGIAIGMAKVLAAYTCSVHYSALLAAGAMTFMPTALQVLLSLVFMCKSVRDILCAMPCRALPRPDHLVLIRIMNPQVQFTNPRSVPYSDVSVAISSVCVTIAYIYFICCVERIMNAFVPASSSSSSSFSLGYGVVRRVFNAFVYEYIFEAWAAGALAVAYGLHAHRTRQGARTFNTAQAIRRGIVMGFVMSPFTFTLTPTINAWELCKDVRNIVRESKRIKARLAQREETAAPTPVPV